MKRGLDYVGVAVVTLCHDGKGEYLLGLRTDKCRDEHFRWDLIGSGGVELGETIVDSLKREVKEEVGSDALNIETLGYREVFRDDEVGKSHYIVFDFKVEVDRDKVVNNEPEKCSELKWFKLEDFPEPMHSQWSTFYEVYKNQL